MSNIWIVTSREYITRIKKKSFIFMTLLTPVLIAAFYGAIIWVSINQSTSVEDQRIVVTDHSKIFAEKIKDPSDIFFLFDPDMRSIELSENDSIDGIVTVPKSFNIDKPLELKYESMTSLSVNNKSRIERAFKDVIRKKKLERAGLQQNTIDSLNSQVILNQYKIDKEGNTKMSDIGINTMLGMALAFLIYMFIFLYGVQVMKGVIEEKTNRIVELIVSTVKPFQLMMGKVLGIALVGLTQLSIWLILSSLLTAIIGVVVGINMSSFAEINTADLPPEMSDINANVIQSINAFINLPLGKIFAVFLFFFMGGYLFYGALFAAIGSAVDNETDTQQFMLPITLPLVFSFAISFSIVVGDPNGTLATWMSIIPISSPVVMMVRMPFDPPGWQILLSMGIMVLSIIGVIWLAGKIYRTGILMYGKKSSYKELAKWLFYKN